MKPSPPPPAVGGACTQLSGPVARVRGRRSWRAGSHWPLLSPAQRSPKRLLPLGELQALGHVELGFSANLEPSALPESHVTALLMTRCPLGDIPQTLASPRASSFITSSFNSALLRVSLFPSLPEYLWKVDTIVVRAFSKGVSMPISQAGSGKERHRERYDIQARVQPSG